MGSEVAAPGGDAVSSTASSSRRRSWTPPPALITALRLLTCAAPLAPLFAQGCSGKVERECPLDYAVRDALCEFHVERAVLIDDSFLPSELRAVRAAMEAWSSASGRRVEYRLLGDAPHHEALAVPACSDQLAIVRLASSVDAELMSNIDSAVAAKGASKGSVVGYALPGRVMLLVERIPDLVLLETVAMHELGHDLGLDHSADTQSVMYAKISGIDDCVLSAPHPTTSDVEALGSRFCKPPEVQSSRLELIDEL